MSGRNGRARGAERRSVPVNQQPGNDTRCGRMRRNFVGRQRYVEDLAEAYAALSAEDEQAARVLQQAGCHRQAVYFYVQAMEKIARSAIYTEVAEDDTDGAGNTYCDRTRTHNLDDLLSLLLEVYQSLIEDPRVCEQIERQMATYVLEGVHFGHLHNDVRYPRFLERRGTHSVLQLSAQDTEAAAKKLARLRSFVEGFQQLKPGNPTMHGRPTPAVETTDRRPDRPEEPAIDFRF